MRNFVSYIVKLFSIGDEPKPNNGMMIEGMSNQKLFDDLLLLFETSLKNESVGQRMLFPMYFDILMHPDDYNQRKDSLAYVLPEVVSSFMNVIDNYRKKFPTVINVSKKWVFQFSPCRVDGELTLSDGSVVNVERGKLIKSAKLFYREDSGSNVTVANNVKVSVKCDNSDVMNISLLNFEALKSIDIVEDGLYMYNYTDDSPINPKEQTDDRYKQPNESLPTNATIATLTYTYQGQRIHYSMQDECISISGRKDKRENKRMVFKLENDSLLNDHVQIKYDRNENKFYLCAFGKTILNQRSLRLSEGGDIKWYDLANNSHILMNDEIQVEFTKNN